MLSEKQEQVINKNELEQVAREVFKARRSIRPSLIGLWEIASSFSPIQYEAIKETLQDEELRKEWELRVESILNNRNRQGAVITFLRRKFNCIEKEDVISAIELNKCADLICKHPNRLSKEKSSSSDISRDVERYCWFLKLVSLGIYARVTRGRRYRVRRISPSFPGATPNFVSSQSTYLSPRTVHSALDHLSNGKTIQYNSSPLVDKKIVKAGSKAYNLYWLTPSGRDVCEFLMTEGSSFHRLIRLESDILEHRRNISAWKSHLRKHSSVFYKFRELEKEYEVEDDSGIINLFDSFGRKQIISLNPKSGISFKAFVADLAQKPDDKMTLEARQHFPTEILADEQFLNVFIQRIHHHASKEKLQILREALRATYGKLDEHLSEIGETLDLIERAGDRLIKKAEGVLDELDVIDKRTTELTRDMVRFGITEKSEIRFLKKAMRALKAPHFSDLAEELPRWRHYRSELDGILLELSKFLKKHEERE